MVYVFVKRNSISFKLYLNKKVMGSDLDNFIFISKRQIIDYTMLLLFLFCYLNRGYFFFLSLFFKQVVHVFV